MTRSRSAFVPLPLLLILLASQNLAADPGCIQGKVLDSAGAPVPSIYVIATSANRKESVQLQTDTDGFFMLDQVLAGEEYEVLASDNPVVRNVSSAIKSVGAVQAIAGTEKKCPSVMLLQPARARLRVKATDIFTQQPADPSKLIFASILKSRGEEESMNMENCWCLPIQALKSRWERPDMKTPEFCRSRLRNQATPLTWPSNCDRCKRAASREQPWIAKESECREPESKPVREARPSMWERRQPRTRRGNSVLAECNLGTTRSL